MKKKTKKKAATKTKRRGKLGGSPQTVNEFVWYYEEPEGLCIVDFLHHGVTYTGPNGHVYLPWKKLLASVERYKRWKRA